jgi:hypothetical protein
MHINVNIYQEATMTFHNFAQNAKDVSISTMRGLGLATIFAAGLLTAAVVHDLGGAMGFDHTEDEVYEYMGGQVENYKRDHPEKTVPLQQLAPK